MILRRPFGAPPRPGVEGKSAGVVAEVVLEQQVNQGRGARSGAILYWAAQAVGSKGASPFSARPR